MLLLQLLPTLIVSPLLVRPLTLLCLLLLDTLALLVLLLAHILELLLMLLLELWVAVRRRIRRSRRWGPIVSPVRRLIVRRLIIRRPVGLRTRRRRIGAFGVSRPVRLLIIRRPIGLRARRRVRPLVRICWLRGRRPIRTAVVGPIRRTIRLRIIRLLRITRLLCVVRPVGRTIRLRVIRTVRVRGRVGRPVVLLPVVLLSAILLNVARLLHGTI